MTIAPSQHSPATPVPPVPFPPVLTPSAPSPESLRSPGAKAAMQTAENADRAVQTMRAGLVRRAAAGDRDAMNDLWQDSRRWAAAVLLAHAPRDPSGGGNIDDLLQAVAVQFVRKVHQVRDPDAFRPWLRAVAINVARGEGRALGTRIDRLGNKLRLVGDGTAPGTRARPHEAMFGSAGGLAVGSGQEPGPTPRVSITDEARRVLELARELPEAYREPLLLRCARGMSYTQIGAVLDLPETTIETRIARGRRMLRERLAHLDDPDSGPTSNTNSTANIKPITTHNTPAHDSPANRGTTS